MAKINCNLKIDTTAIQNAFRNVADVVKRQRETILKNYSTRELINELRKRGINLPKRYR